MKVFNLFLRLFWKHKGLLFMYTGIMFGITLMTVVAGDPAEQSYTKKNASFAVFDYDKTPESEALVRYLSQNGKRVTLREDSDDLFRQELYEGTVDAVLRIEAGFSENKKDSLRLYTIPQRSGGELFTQSINQYLGWWEALAGQGKPSQQIEEELAGVFAIKAQVSTPNRRGTAELPAHLYYFSYIAYVFVAMTILGISPIFHRVYDKELQNRINCSSYPGIRISLEAFLACLVIGAGFLVVYGLTAVVIYQEAVLCMSGLLLFLNMICYVCICLTLAFFVCQLVKSENGVSMIGNTLSLGMSFLGGVFVPLELLSDSVIRLAHFLPSYWYIKAVRVAGIHGTAKLGEYATALGIELLFAAVLLLLGIVAHRRRKGA